MKILISLKYCLLLSTLLIFEANSFGQSSRYEITLSTENFTPEKATRKEFRTKKSQSFDQKQFRLVQFYEIPTDSEKKEWADKGLLITDYLPNYCYYAVISTDFKWKETKAKVRAIVVPDARLKLEAPLYFKQNEVENSNERLLLTISFYQGLSYETVSADLKQQGAILTEYRDYSNQIDIEIEANKLDELTALPYVQFIGEQLPEPINEADNYSYRNTSGRSNYLNTGQNGLMYNGAGVVVAIGEGGTVDNSIDFRGRLNEMETGSASGHKIGSTENCAGAGNIDPTNRCNAWGASIISFSGQSYTSLITNNQARYFNHSYGWGVWGGYDSGARDHDLRMASYPKHIVSYSSGNVGGDTGYAPYNNFSGWANITGAPKQNKNHLAVRNLGPDDEIYNWGSAGPAYDGRIVPQLTIAGPEGTSYATPKAIGVFAILEQVYKETHGGLESDATLLKGIVLNTADDMDDPGPDFRTGYGRPNAGRGHTVIVNNQFMNGSVSNGGNSTHQITVPANLSQVRVLLIWRDAAASVNANPAIVNNLNLSAVSPNSTSYNPWILNHTADSLLLGMPATRGIDSINTVEQITIDNPESGIWNFTVNGHLVPSGPQSYYLIYEFVEKGLEVAYPIENEKMISGDTYQVKWDSFGGSGDFSLLYRLNGGSWNIAAATIPEDIRVYNWNAPIVTGVQQVEFKVIQGAAEAQSGVNYISKRAENFRIDHVCDDTVELKWSAVNNATAYKIYRLGTQYMEEVTSNITFNGTSAVLTQQSTTASEYYAVSAVTGTNEGQRTMTIEKVAGDYNCGGVDWVGIISTDWFTAGNWGSGVVPTNQNNVRIPSTAPFQPLIAASGAKCASILVMNGASLSFSNSSAYSLDVWGDFVNNGTLNAGIGTVAFIDTLMYQEISGSSTNNFYKLKVDKMDMDNVLEVKSLMTLTAPTNPLDLVSGTFELSSNSTITPFTSNGISWTGLWNNGGTINFGNYSWYLNGGLLKITEGTVNVGTNSNNNIYYMNGGTIHMEGGTLNIAARIQPNSGGSSGTFALYGGDLVLNKFGSTSTSNPLLRVNPNATFIQMGGNLILQNASSNTTADLINQSNNFSVGGGNICIGNASTSPGQTIRIQTAVPVYNLVVNSTNSPTARLETSNLTVKNDITVNGGVFNANDLNISFGGNWTNNGIFSQGTGEVTMNGLFQQVIGGTSATPFTKLRIANAAGSLLQNNIQINTQCAFDEGIIETQVNRVTFVDGTTTLTPSANSYIFGNCRKTGNDAFTFPIGSENHYAPLSISAPSAISDHFTASYFHATPDPLFSTGSLLAPIENVSETEYWVLNRTNGSSQVDVTLSYADDRSESIECLANTTIANWDGTQWTNAGTVTVTGDSDNGTMTVTAQDVFNAFTFGNNDAISAPTTDENNQHFCSAVTLNELDIVGTDITWYTDATAGTVLNPTTVVSNDSYYASQTISGCESSDRIEIIVSISSFDTNVDNTNNILTSAQSGVSYQWIDCGTGLAIDGQTSQTFSPTENGSYAVVLDDTFCSDTSSCVTVSTIGIEESVMDNLQIYPNPTTGIVQLVVPAGLIGRNYSVTDASGKQISGGTLEVMNETLSLYDVQTGMYFLSVEGESKTRRIIKN